MMTNAQLATASLDDIVFDGRNQTYGAYLLRRFYQRHVTRALLMASTLLGLFVFAPLTAQWLRGPLPVVPLAVVGGGIIVEPPPLADEVTKPVVPPPAIHPPRRVAVPTVRFTPPKIVEDNRQVEEIANQDELGHATVATATVVGPATLNPDGLAPVEGPAALGDVMKPQVYLSVEQMPELPGGGGTAAIVAAIQKAARYPALALANSVEGHVYASFVVNAQGEVTDLKIVKGLGSGLDEETLRAIGKLPHFIPGKQNGRAVSVQYTVPISFKISN